MTKSELMQLSMSELVALLPPDTISEIPGAETEFTARLTCQELGCARYEIPKEWLKERAKSENPS